MHEPAIYQIRVLGRLADQAMLAGILNRLYELHLLSANCIDSEDVSGR